MERATFNDKHTDECHDLEETDFEIFDFIANVKDIITNKPHMSTWSQNILPVQPRVSKMV
jgi:hypothetical protein